MTMYLSALLGVLVVLLLCERCRAGFYARAWHDMVQHYRNKGLIYNRRLMVARYIVILSLQINLLIAVSLIIVIVLDRLYG